MSDPSERQTVSELSFEEAEAELEAINQKLADGKAPLEEQLTLHERAADLDVHCRTLLDSFEARLRQLDERRQSPSARPGATSAETDPGANMSPVPPLESSVKASPGGWSDKPPF